ncbi:Calsyntenin-2 [Liparis tanakae]|uniref:Calsyntenin-2 n=1 Tax=Liparis tanakae TaxID=230148 RepID=A0A4Z2EQG6_9TELE|nr:Calsyntenin-2 [Liparis tanakae]
MDTQRQTEVRRSGEVIHLVLQSPELVFFSTTNHKLHKTRTEIRLRPFIVTRSRGYLKICDKEWHYYVINVEFPVVTLYVDGVTYDPYLVTDDWPIHPSLIDVQLTVGACWQGGEVTKPRFTQYFRGSLSGLTVRPGKIESQKVISCLQACKEGLDINSPESLDKSIKV